MSTFFNYAIRNDYAKLSELGNTLGKLSSLIDRDAAQHFLGYPTKIPDHSTI